MVINGSVKTFCHLDYRVGNQRTSGSNRGMYLGAKMEQLWRHAVKINVDGKFFALLSTHGTIFCSSKYSWSVNIAAFYA